MRVKISWDQGSTFERECWLDDCIHPNWDSATYRDAMHELRQHGRYWLYCGDDENPSCLLMLVR